MKVKENLSSFQIFKFSFPLTQDETNGSRKKVKRILEIFKNNTKEVLKS